MFLVNMQIFKEQFWGGEYLVLFQRIYVMKREEESGVEARCPDSCGGTLISLISLLRTRISLISLPLGKQEVKSPSWHGNW